ncbi:MAG: glycosyltransferase family 87 protein, partial [Acidimicrobiales bacterium]
LSLLAWTTTEPLVSLAVVGLGGWGLVVIAFGLAPGALDSRRLAWVGWITLLAVLVGLGLWSYFQIVTSPAYPTDEVAFDQYAALLLSHGHDPYLSSMAPSIGLYHLAPTALTFHLNGSQVTSLSYPAMSFLLYAPAVLLGWSTQAAVVLNLVAWVIAVVLLFLVLPRSMAPVALIIGSFSVYVGYAVGGVTDALFVPLLLGAAVGWDKFVTASGWRKWIGPVLFGLAMAVKQTPWLVLPFLVVGIAIEGWRRLGDRRSGVRAGAQYLAVALAAFAVPNLPFIVMGARAWWDGVLTPLDPHIVPGGSGIVGLSLYLGVGGGSLGAFSLAVLVAFVALLVIYSSTYPLLKGWTFILPAFVLFFSARSFGSYLLDLVPAALVGAWTCRSLPGRPWSAWPWVVAGGTVVTGGVVALALGSQSPLTMSIRQVYTSGQLATVDRVVVNVANVSSRPERPAFTMDSGTSFTAFWIPEGGPAVLAPGTSANYTLLSPDFPSQPSIAGGFQVVAFTNDPATVSRTGSYLPTTYHIALVPNAVDHVVHVGQPVHVTAEVLDRLDRPVPVAGIPVYLGQVIYAQQGLEFGEAEINGDQPGVTPVSALTNSDGHAQFVIRGTVATTDPVYFEANLVNSTQYYPYGYSEILPVRFVAKGP